MRINSYFSNALFNRDKLAPPKGFVPGANPHAAVGGLVPAVSRSDCIVQAPFVPRLLRRKTRSFIVRTYTLAGPV
jgi:hypothetical protein